MGPISRASVSSLIRVARRPRPVVNKLASELQRLKEETAPQKKNVYNESRIKDCDPERYRIEYK